MVRGFRFSRLLVCIGVSAFSIFAAHCMPSLLLITICFAAFMSAAWGYLYSILPLVSGGFTLIIGYQGSPSLYCIIAVFFVALTVLSICATARVSYRTTLLIMTGIFCCGIYVYLTIDSVMDMQPPTTQVVERWNEIATQFSQSVGDTNILKELYGPDIYTEVASILPDILLTMVLMLAELLGLISIFLTRLIFRIFKVKTRRMAPFHRWRLPKSIIGGTVFLIAACIGLRLLRLNAATATGLAIGTALASAYSVQGLSYLFYTYRRTGSPPAVYTCTVIAALVFLPYSFVLLVPLGIIEQIGKRRLMYDAAYRQRMVEAQLLNRRNEYEKYGYTRDIGDTAPKPKDEDSVDKKDNSSQQ